MFKYAEDSYTKVYSELMHLHQHIHKEICAHNEEVAKREDRLVTKTVFQELQEVTEK